MGYDTDFEGYFELDRPLSQVVKEELFELAHSPHLGDQYPGQWCQWVPTHDGEGIEWDGGEKFYEYVEWLRYIIDKILAPRGYVLNGEVRYRGEDFDDLGTIIVEDNVVEDRPLKW